MRATGRSVACGVIAAVAGDIAGNVTLILLPVRVAAAALALPVAFREPDRTFGIRVAAPELGELECAT
jgi:hypothetical protein